MFQQLLLKEQLIHEHCITTSTPGFSNLELEKDPF